MYFAEGNGYNLVVEYDQDPINPREYGGLGKMICWHERYNLGDEHEWEAPEDFLRELLGDNCSLDLGCAKLVFDFIKAGKAKEAKLIYNKSRHRWELFSAQLWAFEKWAWECEYPASEKNTPAWFLDECISLLSMCEMLELLDAIPGIIILPLYLYDHSQLSISTKSFIGRAVHAEWDSGQVGWTYADRKMIEREYGEFNEGTKEEATQLLVAKVKEYDAYLFGECYEFTLYSDKGEVDSCCGFIGSDYVARIRECLPDDAKFLVDELRYA